MKLRERIKRLTQMQRAMRELAALDDRALEDLGVSRSSIRAAVEGRL
ncbi:DUF1127 domain-containing protein [Neorhizobium alkalisoli]|nr:DUF1127 domain-containing protein [Neorhizobium alkalisoli]